MERREFSPYLVGLHFLIVGGQCECTGCWTGGPHYGRCARTFRLENRANSDALWGWQADHINGSDDNSPNNMRILCIDCHKATASYGRSSEQQDVSFERALFAAYREPQSPPAPDPNSNPFATGNPFLLQNPFINPFRRRS